jgi:Tol biopolymer transport system component
MVAALAGAGAVALAVVAVRPRPVVPPVQAVIEPPAGVLYSSSTDRPLPLAISPDGSTIAFCARDGEGPDLLWVRSLGADDARGLPGTEGAEGPFFSPDGKSLGFHANGSLKRVDVAGGPVIELVRDIDYRGGTWGKNGDIVFSSSSSGPLSRVAEDGGPVATVTALDTTLGEATHRYPHFLPDGEHYLFLARRAGAGKGEKPFIYATELGSSACTPVVEVASNVAYASGHILYVQGTMLVAQRFDLSSRKTAGPPVPLVDDVRTDERFSRSVFAASANGVLLCMTGADQSRTQLRWLDRSGRKIADVGEPADYTYGGTPNISPDGKSAVLAIANRDRGTSDVWIIDLGSGRRRKLTVDSLDHPHAVWLPDGKSVGVTTNLPGRGGVDALSIDGLAARRVVNASDFTWPMSAFGDHLLYTPEDAGSQLADDIFRVSLSGRSEPVLLTANTKAKKFHAQFSPGGKFVAYTSDETGREEVFVMAYPSGGRWQVSQSGGTEPRWNRNGREMFYMDPLNNLISVDVETEGSSLEVGEARALFPFHGAGGFWRYDVSPDGTRFLVTTPLEEDLASPVLVITDWTRNVAGR